MRTMSLLVTLTMVAGCQTAPQLRTDEGLAPTLPSESIELLAQTLTDCTVRYTGMLQAADLDVTLQKAIIELVVEGEVVSKREQTLVVELAAGSSHVVTFDQTFTYVKDADALEAMEGKGKTLLVSMRGVLMGSVKTADGAPQVVQVPFARGKELRTPRPPQIKVIDFEAGRFSDSEVQVLFHVGVVNSNPFDILLTGLTYTVTLAGKKVAEAHVGKGERVSAASTGVFDVSVTMNEETYGPEVKAIIKSLIVPYILSGELTTALSTAQLDVRGEIKLRSTN